MANINQWKVGDIISASRLNEMVNAINDILAQQQIPGIDTSNLITNEQLTTILQGYSDVGHTHTISEIVDLVLPTVPTRTSQLTNDSNFISSIPEEYVTEQELAAKGFATETFVTNKIAEASMGGGEGSTVDLSGVGADLSLNGQTLKLKNSNGVEIGTGVTLPQASTIDAYTKTETDNLIQDYTGGKKQVYLTQAEYDILSDAEKNDSTKVYNIVDVVELVVPQDLNLDNNNLLQLKDKDGNKIGTGVSIPNTYTLPPATADTLGGIKVGNRLSIDSNGVLSADLQESSGGTADEVILTSPGGYRFKLTVNDEGVLNTEEIVIYGNILASVSELSINEGESKTFTVSLSQVPTRPQTITIASNNTDVTVNPSSIAISDTNPHTLTVSVAEDDTDYADETATLTLSSANVSNVTINVAIKDNDIEPKPCTGITLDQTSLSLTKGKTKQLVATVTPEGCTDEIVWSTSNENCTVVNGLVKAVTEGDCVITAQCGEYNATCTVTIVVEQQPDIITNGLLMYFDSTLISKEAHTPINNTSINDAIVPDQTLRFRNFKDDGTDGIADDYKGIFFNGTGLIEPMMNNATTVFGGTEETSIRTVEIFGKFNATINPSNKGIGGIAYQHSPTNFSRQLVKRISDGYEIGIGCTVVRQLNYPGYQVAMNDGYFHVAYTNAEIKNPDNNNLCDWLSFAFGTSSNNGSLLNTTIYAVRLYNRVLSSDELNLNMSIDLAKVNYTQSTQENYTESVGE